MRERAEFFLTCCRGVAMLWKLLLVFLAGIYLIGTMIVRGWELQVLRAGMENGRLEISQIRGEALQQCKDYSVILQEQGKIKRGR